jgi:hypothetical protein
MYLGICINNNDPEKRGRVQIFIPHIMPALYKEWNEAGKDIEITCVGDNMPQGLSGEMIHKLTLILPWAEAASPIIGSSAPGTLMGAVMGAAEAVGQAAGKAAAAVGSAAKAVVSQVYEQSPAAEPVDVSSMQDLFKEAGKYNSRGVNADKLARTGSKDGLCGIGSRSILGAMTGDKYFAGGLGSDRMSYASSLALGQGNNYLSKSGYFNPPTQMPSSYMGDKSQWQVGDTIVSGGGGGEGKGHIQVWTGTAWVSDHTQSRLYDRNKNGAYNNFTLYRANEKGAARMQERLGGAATKPGPKEATSLSGEVAAASPHQSPNPLGTDVKANDYGNIANPNVTLGPPGTGAPSGTLTGKSTIDTSNMSPAFKSQYDRVYNSLEGSKFIGTVPKDGATYGIKTGSREEWAHFFTRNASVESGFNPNTSADINGLKKGPLTSFGLYQMGSTQFKRHGGGDIYNPNDNTKAYLNYAESMYFGNTYKSGGQNVIAAKKEGGGWYGLAAGYGPLRRISTGNPNTNEKQLLAENMSKSEQQKGNYTGSVAASQPITPSGVEEMGQSSKPVSMVQNVDSHGATVTQNINNMAKGVFSFPAAGSMLWVFFRDGNPQFPVYFAASYSQSEWSSVYRLGSDGPGYRPVASPDNPVTSTGGVMNLNGVGGIRWEDTNNPENRLQDQKSIMFFGEDGSNIFMGKGYNQYFSKFDRRDQVEGDRWETTLGNKEEWTQADKNVVVMGDLYVKIGNVSQPAVDAVMRIQEIIGEIQKPLSETSGGGGGGGGGGGSGSSSEPGSSKMPDKMQKALDDKRKEMEKSWGMSEDPGKFKMQTENKVPGYLQAGASQSTIDKFRSDSNALQAQRNKQTFQNMPSFSNAGTATTGLKGVPSTITVPSGALRSSSTPSLGFSTGSGLSIKASSPSVSNTGFSSSHAQTHRDNMNKRAEILRGG